MERERTEHDTREHEAEGRGGDARRSIGRGSAVPQRSLVPAPPMPGSRPDDDLNELTFADRLCSIFVPDRRLKTAAPAIERQRRER
jgi:hypothetical protein